MMKKDPDAKLPFSVDWAAWLANEGDEAQAVEWTVPDGIVKETSPPPSLSEGRATIWLSGGQEGVGYKITCRMRTTAGRVDDRSFFVKVASR